MSLNRQEFTSAGRSMLGRANNGESLTISNVVIGSGRADTGAELWPLEDLINRKMVVPILRKTDQGDGVLLIDIAFNSSQASEAFELREVGVVAYIGNEAPRLYSVANALNTGVDQVDPAIESIHAFKIKVVIDRAQNVTIIIGESRDILAENIGAETVGPGWFKEKIANTLGFKRAVPGPHIDIREASDRNSIIIGQKTLEIDLDLFVNPVFDNVAPNFNNLQSAIDYLLDYTIPSNRWATINVSGDRYTLTRDIECEHLDGARIRIRGVTPRNVPVSNMNGTTANIVCSVAGANTLGLAVGDVVLLYDGHPAYDGGYQIVNNPGPTTITVIKNFQAAGHNQNLATPGGQMQWNPTSFRNFGMIFHHGIGEFSNISIIGTGPNGGTRGLIITQGGTIRNIIAAEHQIGIAEHSGRLDIEGYSAVSHNIWGLTNFEGASVYAADYNQGPDPGTTLWANCNISNGIWLRQGISGLGTHHPDVRYSYIITVSNGSSGIESSDGANVGIGCWHSCNERVHLRLRNGGRMTLGQVEPSSPGLGDGGYINLSGGLDYEIFVEDASYGKFWHWPGGTDPSIWRCEPPLNDWSQNPRNGLSFIHWINDPRFEEEIGQRPEFPPRQSRRLKKHAS